MTPTKLLCRLGLHRWKRRQEWETTAEDRARLRAAGDRAEALWADKTSTLTQRLSGSVITVDGEKIARLLRDFDRLSSALATKDYLLRLCEDQHHRDEAALSAERDQNKRLVEALGEAMAWVEECNRVWNHPGWRRDQSERAKAIDAALAQPEEQR